MAIEHLSVHQGGGRILSETLEPPAIGRIPTLSPQQVVHSFSQCRQMSCCHTHRSLKPRATSFSWTLCTYPWYSLSWFPLLLQIRTINQSPRRTEGRLSARPGTYQIYQIVWITVLYTWRTPSNN